MLVLNSLLPFIGILSLLWALGALLLAIFPGNRKRRLKFSGIAFVIFVVAIIVSPRIEQGAERQELASAGVSTRAELEAIQEQQAAEQAAESEALAVASYVDNLGDQIASVRALTAGEFTESIDSIMFFLLLIDGLAQLIEEGRNFELTTEQELRRQDLRQALSRKQAEIFPTIRDNYGPALRQRLWQHDGYARTFGSGYRRIEVVNALFAANRNIAEFHGTVLEILLHLRFTRVDYKWYRQATEYSYYTLEVPSDGTVGYWQGVRFHQVD